MHFLFGLLGMMCLLTLSANSSFALNATSSELSVLQATAHDEYVYVINVDAVYCSKEILAAVTDQLNVTKRYIIENGFTFNSGELYSEEYLAALFLAAGVPNIGYNVTSMKAPYEGVEKVGGTNCENAELLCSNGSLAGNSGGGGIAELNGSNQGCLGIEHQSSWYYLNVQTGGTLTFTIDPTNNSDDYDFALWGPFTSATAGVNCPPVSAPLRCSYSANTDLTGLMIPYSGQSSSIGCGFLGLFPCTGIITTVNNPADVSEGAGGDSWLSNLTVTAGQVYILLIDNFSASSNPYNMSFGGTGVLGCTQVVLPVEIAEFTGFSSEFGNVLKWTTESEKDNNYFLVEKMSADKINQWEFVEQVYTSGDTWTQKNYTIIDSDLDNRGMTYYRLSQVDNDGTSTTFEDIVAIDNSGEMRKAYKTVNLLGQEVDPSAKGIVLYIFEDGTTLKMYK